MKDYLIMVFSTKQTKTPRKGFILKAENKTDAHYKAKKKLKNHRYYKFKILPTLGRAK